MGLCPFLCACSQTGAHSITLLYFILLTITGVVFTSLGLGVLVVELLVAGGRHLVLELLVVELPVEVLHPLGRALLLEGAALLGALGRVLAAAPEKRRDGG